MRNLARIFATMIVCCALACRVAAALAGPPHLRALNCDLKKGAGPLPEIRYRELAALLLYAHPDIAVLHNARSLPAAPGQGPVESLARSLRMYYLFEPVLPGRDVGSALLSRYPIRAGGALSASARDPWVPGLRAELSLGKKTLRVMAVRPSSRAEANASGEIVARAVTAQPEAHWLVMASLDPGWGLDAVKAWGRAGLQDAAVASKGKTEPTFPASAPRERLDFILISGSLRAGLGSLKVLRDARARGLADHLPVEVTLAY